MKTYAIYCYFLIRIMQKQGQQSLCIPFPLATVNLFINVHVQWKSQTYMQKSIHNPYPGPKNL